MLTKKQIEKVPDGYIRDLLCKKKKNQSIFVTLNAVALGFFILMSAIFAFAAFKPLPTELESGTYVMNLPFFLLTRKELKEIGQKINNRREKLKSKNKE